MEQRSIINIDFSLFRKNMDCVAHNCCWWSNLPTYEGMSYKSIVLWMMIHLNNVFFSRPKKDWGINYFLIQIFILSWFWASNEWLLKVEYSGIMESPGIRRTSLPYCVHKGMYRFYLQTKLNTKWWETSYPCLTKLWGKQHGNNWETSF